MKVDSEFKNKIGIYCIKNMINGKMYVGSSSNIYIRLLKHRSMLKSNSHQNKYLQNSWNKYKEENFICFCLEYCKFEELEDIEQKYINNFGEYNLTKIVKRNILSKESREKQSRTRKLKFISGEIIPTRIRQIDQYDLNGNFIKTWKSIKEASETLKINKSSIHRNLSGLYNKGGNFIWKYSEDTKKIFKYKKKVKIQPVRYKVIVKDIINDKEIYFNSINDCAKHFNVKRESINQIIQNQNAYKKQFYIVKELINKAPL